MLTIRRYKGAPYGTGLSGYRPGTAQRPATQFNPQAPAGPTPGEQMLIDRLSRLEQAMTAQAQQSAQFRGNLPTANAPLPTGPPPNWQGQPSPWQAQPPPPRIAEQYRTPPPRGPTVPGAGDLRAYPGADQFIAFGTPIDWISDPAIHGAENVAAFAGSTFEGKDEFGNPLVRLATGQVVVVAPELFVGTPFEQEFAAPGTPPTPPSTGGAPPGVVATEPTGGVPAPTQPPPEQEQEQQQPQQTVPMTTAPRAVVPASPPPAPPPSPPPPIPGYSQRFDGASWEYLASAPISYGAPYIEPGATSPLPAPVVQPSVYGAAPAAPVTQAGAGGAYIDPGSTDVNYAGPPSPPPPPAPLPYTTYYDPNADVSA